MLTANETPTTEYMSDVRDEIAAAMQAATGIDWDASAGGFDGRGLSFYAEVEVPGQEFEYVTIRVSDHGAVGGSRDIMEYVDTVIEERADPDDEETTLRLYADDTDAVFTAAAVRAVERARAEAQERSAS